MLSPSVTVAREWRTTYHTNHVFYTDTLLFIRSDRKENGRRPIASHGSFTRAARALLHAWRPKNYQ